ncbi:putative lipoprotein [Leptospira noguchii str. 2001034031]|uniref:Putative lipoprotein n=2 Tax=Leptospira noguchii TaxID=28182 RepID=M6YCQ1_9LEPT|nr:putative lipoprotein [Leptospira noguchii str. 2001034031]
MKIAAVAALAVALTACKGDDDDDDVVMLALLYLADQTSGNCVTLTKDDAAHSGAAGAGDGKPTYTATGNTRPKAACAGTFNTVFIVNNAEAVATSVKAAYQAAKEKAGASGSNCAAVSTGLQTTADLVTSLKVQQTLAGTGFCANLGIDWNLNLLTFGGSSVSVDPNPEYFGKTVLACPSEQAKEKQIALLSGLSFSTIAGSVATDMTTNLAFRQKSAAVTASNYKWTADAAAKGRLINVTELTTAGKSGAALVAFRSAALAGASTCAKDILSKESEEAQRIAFSLYDPAAGFNGAVTGVVLDSIITTAQAQSATEVLLTSLTCKYGDFDEENTGNKTTVGTETNVKNTGTCPATYPRY